jgi:hypothetical protein
MGVGRVAQDRRQVFHSCPVGTRLKPLDHSRLDFDADCLAAWEYPLRDRDKQSTRSRPYFEDFLAGSNIEAFQSCAGAVQFLEEWAFQSPSQKGRARQRSNPTQPAPAKVKDYQKQEGTK